jgi:tripeptide aminopeptidase
VHDGLDGEGVPAEEARADPLLELFVRLAGIASPTGSEREIADVVSAYLRDLGLDVREDQSAASTGCGSGNVIAVIGGRGEAAPIGLCAHLDTVPMDRAPSVIVADGQVGTDGVTPLGADDKAAVAVLLELAAALALDPPAGDVELIFTAGEEAGLLGATALDIPALSAERVFVLDSDGEPGTLITGAPTQKRIEGEFTGQAAHAGIAPETGRSAVVAAAKAVAAMRLGRLDDETTANIGVIEGGTGCNVVAEHCRISGEARSHDEAKLAAQVEHMVQAAAAEAAAAGVDVEIDVREAFRGYSHAADSPLLAAGAEAARLAGLEPRLRRGGGGSDANVFNARGLPALTLGVGFRHAHSPRETMSVEHLHQLAAVAAGLVRAAGAAA